MRSVVISAGRRALATLVLVLSGIAAVDAAESKVWHPVDALGGGTGKALSPAAIKHLQSLSVDCRYGCTSTRPGWAIPVAIAIGLAGVLVAAAMYRPVRSRQLVSHWRRLHAWSLG